MKFHVGVTDNDWFAFLAERKPEDLNFWQPGGGAAFKALAPGEPFLFKLHAPFRFITGGGFFVRHTRLPISMAWEVFGEKNGVPDFITFRNTIRSYRERKGDHDPDPVIGCIVLTEPFFFARNEWIPEPEDWSNSIVQGKGYDTSTAIGGRIWAQVQERLAHRPLPAAAVMERQVVTEGTSAYGAEFLTRARLGQSAFRVAVIEAYHRRCALTGEKTLPVLTAAHIKPYSRTGPHKVSNGLLLRSDLHLLFDHGLITVTPEYVVEVSKRIREQYENGRIYYALHGQAISLPEIEQERPDRMFLEWHNREVYVG